MVYPDLLLLVVGISFTLATLLVFCINIFWKISIHCVGVGGAVALLFPIAGRYGMARYADCAAGWMGQIAFRCPYRATGIGRLYLGRWRLARGLLGGDLSSDGIVYGRIV